MEKGRLKGREAGLGLVWRILREKGKDSVLLSDCLCRDRRHVWKPEATPQQARGVGA